MATQPAARPSGPDPLRVDSKHYAIEVEDDKVRVLRARYGPREKSAMHGHPGLVAIMLTEANIRMTYPDGRTEIITAKAGEVLRMPAIEHQPENLSDRVFEAVLIELK